MSNDGTKSGGEAKHSAEQSQWFAVGTKHCGWLIGLCGAALAFMLIFLGFWKTLLISIFFAVGYLFGSNNQKIVGIKNFINKIFPPKGE